MTEKWRLTDKEIDAAVVKPPAPATPEERKLFQEWETDYAAAKERDMSEKIGAGQAELRMRQGLAELGKAFGQALPDAATVDMPGVVVPTSQEVAEIKAPEPQREEPEPEM